MDFASLIGIISGISLIISAIFLSSDINNFMNTPGIMIVLGGTTAATLLTFPFRDVFSSFKAAFFVFRQEKQNPNESISMMLKLSTISRRKGLLALSGVKTASPFLKRACNLIADSASEEMIRNALRNEIEAMKIRHFIIQDIFKKMAIYAPAFGMLGTLIGLIQMLSDLEDPTNIGPAMAIALLTTFYGSLLANMLFLPIAGKLRSRTLVEVLNLEIIFEGAISIVNNNNPLAVYERLSSFIPANNRQSLSPIKGK